MLRKLRIICIFLICYCVIRSEAWYEYCDHVVDVPSGGIYIASPNYPNNYYSGTSCRYHLIAPIDTEITIQCAINIDTADGPGGSQCGTELFYFSLSGDRELRDAEYVCGSGNLIRTSQFNRMTLSYTSASYSNAGSFTCLVSYRQPACDCGWSMGSKIVGGTEAKITEFPFMAGLMNKDQNVYCGGSIISHRFILTAAHCLDVFYPVQIIVGDHDLNSNFETPFTQRHYVLHARKHENYDKKTNFADIAYVVTVKNIEWTMGVGPICLPFLFSSATFDGLQVDLAGWGTTAFAGPKSNLLLKTTVNIVKNSVCENLYSDMGPTKLCSYTYLKDSCQYDSGGPVVLRSRRLQLIGVISYGKDCGNSPAVNTRITSYLDWIVRNTGEQFCRKS